MNAEVRVMPPGYFGVAGFKLESIGNVMPPTTAPSIRIVASIRGGRRFPKQFTGERLAR